MNKIINKIIDKLNILIEKKNFKIKNSSLLQKIFMFLILFYTILCPIFIKLSYTVNQLIFMFLIFGCIATGIKNKIEFNEITMFLKILISIFFVFGIINAVYNRSIGFIVVTINFSILLPILVILLDNCDLKATLKNFATMSILVYCIHFLFTIFYMPISNLQYSGLISDPNGFSLICIVNMICSLYLLKLHKNENKLVNNIFYYFIISSAFAFIVFSKSRAAILCILALLVTECVYHFYHRNYKLSHMFSFLLILLVTYISLFMFLTRVTPNLSRNIYHTLGNRYEKQYEIFFPNVINKTDDLEIDKIKEKGIESSVVDFYKRGTKGLDGADNITSGRIGIWTDYLESVKILGNKEERIFTKSYSRTMSPHNSLIQIWYSLGFFPFLALLGIYCYVVLWSLRTFFNTKYITIYELFTLQILGMNFISNNLSSQFNVFSTYATPIFYVLVYYLMYKGYYIINERDLKRVHDTSLFYKKNII